MGGTRKFDASLAVSIGTAIFAVTLALAFTAHATVLNPGDIVVADQDAGPGLRGALIKVNPSTGAQEFITPMGDNDLLFSPFGVVFESSGTLAVVDPHSLDSDPVGVVRVDPATGTQTLLARHGFSGSPSGITVDSNGDLLVADAAGGVFRVDPITGNVALLYSGDFLMEVFAIALAANGDLVISGIANNGGTLVNGIVRISRPSGTQSLVSFGGYLRHPFHLAVAPNGDIIVSDDDAFGGGGGIIRIDPVSGAQSVISRDQFFVDPRGVALASNGDIIVADFNAFGGSGGVIRVNPTTGEQTVISKAGLFVDPNGLTIVPDTTGPTITIFSPTSTTYLLNQVASAYSCMDTDDAVTLCAGPVADGLNIDTASVGAKTFAVNAADSHNNSSTKSVNYSVAYNICTDYDTAHAKKSGSTVPIKLQLCDVNGVNQSASSIVLHATGAIMVSSNASEPLADSGNANPDFDFRFIAGNEYMFNLSTSGYPSGTFALQFTAGSDPTSHNAYFQVK